MNNTRRKALKSVLKTLEQANELIMQAVENLENVLDEEEEAFDNMPESFQESERGETMQECIDNLGTVLDTVQEWDFEEITDLLDEIIS